MTTATDPGSLQLRDIHLPESVSWWPVAPGWWMLLALLLLFAWLLRYWWQRRQAKRHSLAVLTAQQLQRIRSEFGEHQDKDLLARELSELLRRTSISVFQRQEAASLTGSAWLEFLDQQTGEQHFASGVGRILIEAPYRENIEYDTEALLALVERWLQSVVEQRPRETR